jgi:putative CocE/NonD family hydrolase
MTAGPCIVDPLPEPVEIIDPVWIMMADGCRLAARLWLPTSARARPVPAILEYIPYRRRDATVIGDKPRHGYVAGHGYACLRVDMRGSGDSDGVLLDEYLKQEQDDALEVIAWIAAQPWCSGQVGMIGISWGGFNALQVAARRPPALKAIITVCSTDDRYADDCHYMGGALLLNSLSWGSTMFAYNARPPDPLVVGERWRDMWMQRLNASPPFLAAWLQHQLRDDYWKHGSVCEDYGAIEAATYAIGGWADAYTNAIPRLLANLKAPAKGLIGPWAHEYPHLARPGPQIGFLQESLRWWDHWLKGRDTGIMREPKLRAWIQDSVPPAADYDERPGRWVGEAAWLPTRDARLALHLGDGRLLDAGIIESVPLTHSSSLVTGITWGEWCPYGFHGELPVDQRPDDGRSLCFDGAPLAEPLELLGAPVLKVRLAIDRPAGLVVARLCDIAPDGSSRLMSYGVLNLTHRSGHDRAVLMTPGQFVDVDLQLNDLGERIAAGHRLRLALSTSYWPMAWPSAEPVMLTLMPGASTLSLPLRLAPTEERQPTEFQLPEMARPVRVTRSRQGRRDREIHENPTAGETVFTIHRDRGAYRLHDIDLTVDGGAVERFSIAEGDPLSAKGDIAWRYRMTRGGWDIRTESRTVLTASKDAFHLRASLDAFEGETRVFTKNWSFDIPRNGV